VKSWIKNVWESLQCEPGRWWPQPALVIIGVTGSGKSSLQDEIITPILGRVVDPTLNFTGETSFNSHLGKAEHLKIADPKWSSKREKDKFVGELKEVVANSATLIHPKGKEATMMKIFRRVTISLNDEEEPMSIFPLMPESTLEKLIFIRADGFSSFTPKGGPAWTEWCEKVRAELPAFLWHLVHEYQVPKEVYHHRYGVAYRNEAILARVKAPTAEEKLGDAESVLWEAIFSQNPKESEKSLTSTGLSSSNIVFGTHYPNSIFIIRIGWRTYLSRGAFQPITFITRTLRIYIFIFNISRQSRRCSRSKKVLSVMARLPRLVIIPLAQSALLRESTKVSGGKATTRHTFNNLGQTKEALADTPRPVKPGGNAWGTRFLKEECHYDESGGAANFEGWGQTSHGHPKQAQRRLGIGVLGCEGVIKSQPRSVWRSTHRCPRKLRRAHSTR
jgi:hypothetical protein